MAVAKPSVPSAASGSQRRPSYRRRLGYHRRSQPIPSTSSTSTTTSSTTSTNTFTRNMAAHTVDARTGSPEEFGGRVHLDQGRTGSGASARLLPAIAAGERVARDALVSPDEHVPVDAAPAEPEARRRGERVRVRGVAVGRVRIQGVNLKPWTQDAEADSSAAPTAAPGCTEANPMAVGGRIQGDLTSERSPRVDAAETAEALRWLGAGGPRMSRLRGAR